MPDPDELATLIATLNATLARLDEITAGEVDSISDASGSSFLLRRAQNALRLTDAARQAAILNALPLHIALIDDSGSILTVNDAWNAFAQANSAHGEDVGVGCNYLDICDRAVGTDAAEAQQAGAGIRAVLDGSAPAFTLEYPCHSPTLQRWFRMTVSPVVSSTSIGAVIMHLDVSSRRLARLELEESELRFRQLAENIPEVFFLREPDGSRFFYVSPAYEEIWGRSRETLYANPATWVESIHPDDRAATLETSVGSPSGEFQNEYRVIRPDGSIRWVHSRGYPVRDGDGALIRIAGVVKDITERKRAERTLRESERRYSEMLSNVELFAVMLDLQGRVTFCNDYLLRMTGWSRPEILDNNWFDLFIPADDKEIRKAFAELLAEAPESWHYENHILTRTGEFRLIRWNNSILRSEEGTVIGSASIGEDITDARVAEARVRYLNRVHAILSGINALIVRARDRDELFAEACRIAVDTGGFRMAMIGNIDLPTGKIDAVTSSGKDVELMNAVMEILTTKALNATSMVGVAISEKRILVANNSLQDPRVLLGARYAEAGVRSLAVFPLIVADVAVGVFVLYAGEVEFFHDEEMKLLTELAGDIAFAIDHIDKSRRLDYLAFYDALTGLPSANLFKDRLDKFIQGARQDQGEVCVVAIDVERFTQINDSLGRIAGDELLRAIAARFEQFLVEPFALSRIGGDTFAVASPGEHEPAPTRLSDCIHRALELPFSVASQSVNVTVQTGIALFPADGDDGESVFKNAEAALKLGKASGARTTYHSNALNARVAERYALEQELHGAIQAGEFVLHYQRRMDLISGELVGAEALIRWQHPTRGLVAPDDFIALAEETGLIVPIGAWVLETVCAQQAAWVAAGLSVVPVGINLSSIQFGAGNLVESVSAAVAANRLEPRLLVLELTETAVMSDPLAAAVALRALRKIGVGLALDDFGTGYSSLAHLKRFPFDSVKIDRSFITDITSNPEDAAIATAIIAMAHGLKLKVVAEGVETQGQFNYLRAKSCDEVQGYLFGPPVPKDEFELQLRSSRRFNVPAPDPADQRTLLIVDDEQGIRASLVRMLRSDGYRILQADSGQAALDLLALNDVHVIISDQRMPGMTGTEFLSTVSRLYPNTVRMILSGFTDLKVVTDAVNRGSVFKFLTKPWDDNDLREQVRDAFRRYRAPSA